MSSITVDLSVLPVDVGFDLRVVGIGVIVDLTVRLCAFDRDGRECIVQGSPVEIASALEMAGYVVRLATAGARGQR